MTTRIEQAARAYAQIEVGRRGRRGHMHRVLLPAGPLMLDFIDAYRDCHPYGPTYRDIADGCRLSSPSVAFYPVELLERRGLISRDPLIARSIRTRREQTAEPEGEGAAA